MIQIKNIIKKYLSGENEVVALKDVSINFRNNEFVSILGPSGCGKTTMLNIIGGLDKYTSGDLIINGISTKEYKDRDWDSYRNHSVGFVFQSYNLIPHQTVLQNVEIALTLSGVSKSERRARAKKALEDVGLGDQIHKKPNAMSGGQMQRVAIARALVNNPDIILADEPTGALDTETSVQVMEILKEVAKERLVVMVTHNPELAEKYSTRIINMLDGKITGDSKPYTDLGYTREQNKEIKRLEGKKKDKKPTMSFWTAMKLSLKNLFTKKGRTILTSFAGSIGIIGIALILAVSQGMTTYINHVQETTLASYPVTLEAQTVDLTSLMNSFMNVGNGSNDHDKDAIYKDPIIADLVNALSQVQTNTNDLKSFKNYLEDEMQKDGSKLNSSVTGIQYSYNLELAMYTRNKIDNKIIKSDTNELMSDMIMKYMQEKADPGNLNNSSNSTTLPTNSNSSSNPMMSVMMNADLWQEILPGIDNGDIINDLVYEQYELIDGGSWPNEYDEVVLVVNENNELDDLTLYALGLISEEEINNIIESAANGTTIESSNARWTYEEIRSRTYKTILPSDCYKEIGGIYVDQSNIDLVFEDIFENKSIELKVTGIVRPKKDSDASLLSSGIGYTSLLTEFVINKAKESEVVKAQINSPLKNVLTGKPFKSNTGTLSNEQKIEAFKLYVNEQLKDNDKAKADTFLKIECYLDPETELAPKIQQAMIPYMKIVPGQEPGLDSEKRDDLQAKMIELINNYQLISMDSDLLNEYLTGMDNSKLMGMAYGIFAMDEQAKHNASIYEKYKSNTEDELSKKLDDEMLKATDEELIAYYDNVTDFSDLSYEEVLIKLGCVDIDSPQAINLYVSSFEDKDIIIEAIDDYNKGVDESMQISYIDYLGIMMSSITTIINAITYVLIAFVSISLVVSSIMIGVITLISVQERTKEIGILRAIGASKRDVSSMFNAETLIIGFSSGLLGVLVTYVLCIPINLILKALTGLANLKAILPVPAAIILVLISMGLTLISGIIPSRSASKKDPVIALRTE